MESDYDLVRVSDGESPVVPNAFDCSPESPDGTRVAYFRFRSARRGGRAKMPGPGEVIVRERPFGGASLGNQTGAGHVVGTSTRGSLAAGARQRWVAPTTLAYCRPGPAGPQVVLTDVSGSDDEPDTRSRTFNGGLEDACPATGLAVYSSESWRELDLEPPAEAVWWLDLSTGERGTLLTRMNASGVHPLAHRFADLAQMRLVRPRWSPDGRRLLCVLTNAEAYRASPVAYGPWVQSLLMVSADGSGLRYVGECGDFPLWGPDGASFYACESLPVETEASILRPGTPRHRPGGLEATVLRPLEGPDRRPVILYEGPGGHGSLSPDGEWLLTDTAVEVGGDPETARAEVVLCRVGGDERIVLAAYDVPASRRGRDVLPNPAWSPDGSRAYFRGPGAAGPHLYAVDLGALPVGPGAPRGHRSLPKGRRGQIGRAS